MNPSASTASLRIDLPPRQVPPPLQRLVKVLQSFGVVLLLMGGILLIADHEWGQLWIRLLLLVFGAIPVAIAWMIQFGRSSVEVRGPQLMICERAGPLRYRRDFTLSNILELQVEELKLNQDKNAPGQPTNEGSITVLTANTRDRGRRVLLFGYPAAELERVIGELRKRR